MELKLMKMIFPQLASIRLERKLTCSVDGRPDVVDFNLIGPFIFCSGVKPSNLQLIIYIPHYSVSLNKKDHVLNFLSLSPFGSTEIKFFVPKEFNISSIHKLIIKTTQMLYEIDPIRIPPLSILPKCYNLTTHTMQPMEINAVESELVLNFEQKTKYYLEKQNINILTAQDLIGVPKEYFYVSFMIVFRKLNEYLVVCDSIDQFMFSFITIDFKIYSISSRKTAIPIKLAAPFPKKNQLICENINFVSEFNDPMQHNISTTPDLKYIDSIPVPMKAAENLEILNFNHKISRTILLHSSLNHKNQLYDTKIIESQIPDVVSSKAFEEEIKNIQNQIDTTQESIKIKPLHENYPSREFMTQSGSELSAVMYFRPIADPKLIFLCQKIGIPFENPVFSMNGEEELNQLSRQKTLNDMAVLVASILINGTTDVIFLSKIPQICNNDQSIMNCLPTTNISPFSKIAIFIARLIKSLRLQKFIQMLSSSFDLRKSLYREDGMCSSTLFLEQLKSKVTVYFSKQQPPLNNAYPLPFSNRERYEYLIRSIIPKAREDENSAIQLIFYIVQFFMQKIKDPSKLIEILSTTIQSIDDENQRVMMVASISSAMKNKQSILGKFAFTLLKGLECGQLYLWILYLGKDIMRNKHFYNADAPATNIENIVIISDSLFKLSGVMFDINPNLLNKYSVFK